MRRHSSFYLLAIALALAGCSGDDKGGANTNTGDTSGGLDDLKPVVTIQRPTDGAVVPSGEAVTFTGTVGDDRDAPDALTVRWVTDRSTQPLSEERANSLGGTTIEVSDLAPGEHVITLAATDSSGKVGTASILITVNEVPGAATVSIAPTEPTTSDPLTATIVADAHDPNRAPSALTYRYRWFKGGAFAEITTATVPAAQTAKGDVWEVHVTADDGFGAGAEATASVTIGNSAPTCTAATLLPSGVDTTNTLECRCSGWHDADGDDAHDRCVFMDRDTPLNDDGGCTLAASATDKGMEIHCLYTPSDGEDDGAPVESANVPVLNAPPTMPEVTLTPDAADATTDVTCGLTAPSTDPDGDSLTYEVTWLVDGFPMSGLTLATVRAGTLTGSDGAAARRGSVIGCRLRASDGAATSAPALSPELTLGNATPVAGNVIVMPLGGGPVNTSTVLQCADSGFSDADGDDLTLSYLWYVNGVEVAGEVGKDLTGAHFAKGDVVTCAVLADDAQGGVSDAEASKTSVAIGNSVPSLLGARLDAAEVSIYDTLTCTPEGWSDPDGDPLEVSYAWYSVENGVQSPIVGASGATLTPDMLEVGDGVVCAVTPRNGAEVGAPVTSAPASIVPPAPIAPVVVVNAPAGADGAVRCDFVSPAQHFAGTVSYVFYWTTNGGTEQPGGATISGQSDCDRVTCRAVATDGVTTLSSQTASLLLPVGDDCATGDACKPPTCNAAGGCSFVQANDIPCSDDNVCTTGDHCELGLCVSDGFAGTEVACEDGLFCTAGDTCDGAGSCRGGADPCVTPAGSCIVGSCNELGDECLGTPKAANALCSDGNGCTQNDRCSSNGVCVPGAAVSCADLDDACVVGVCDDLGPNAHACVAEPRPSGTGCEDGAFCTVNSVCDGAGSCIGGEERDCVAEVGDDCNSAWCSPDLERCLKVPLAAGTACDDSDDCTLVDLCTNGVCNGTGNACVEELLSTGVGSAPTIASVGYGRYATSFWMSGVNEARTRWSDGLGSRENEEVVLTNTNRIATWRARIAANAIGDVAVPYLATLARFIDDPWTVCKSPVPARSVSPVVNGRAYDVNGDLLVDGPVLDWKVGANICYGGQIGSTAGRVQAMAFNDTHFGFLATFNFYTYFPHSWTLIQNQYTTLADKQIHYFPPSGLMTTGAKVTLATSLYSWATWDAARATDGTNDFLVAWVPAARTELRVQRFMENGQAAAGSSNPWVVATDSAGRFQAITVVPMSDASFVAVWSISDEDGSGQGVYAGRFDHEGDPIGSPFRVNSNVSGDQRLGAADRFSNNDFVVVYEDASGDASGFAVKAQLYSSTGVAKGAEIAINTIENGDQYAPAVAVLDTNEWVVAFIDGDHVAWTRRFKADGTPAVGRIEWQLNATEEGPQQTVSAARVGTGAVMTTYESPIPGKDAGEIVVRTLNPAGPDFGVERVANQTVVGAQVKPAIAAGADRFVVAWQSAEQDGSAEGIYARFFSGAGAPAGDEFQVNTTIDGSQRDPAVAMSEDIAAFVWSGAVAGGSVSDIFLRLVGDDETAITDEVLVNQTVDGAQGNPAVTMTPAGEVVVVWEGPDADGKGVWVRTFDSYGAALGDEILVNTWTALDQRSPAVAVSGDGLSVAVCWESYGQDATASLGVYCQVLELATLSKVGPEVQVATLTEGEQRNPHVTWLANGEIVVAWDSEGVDFDQAAIQMRKLSSQGALIGPRVVVNRTWPGEQRRPFLLRTTGSGLLVLWEGSDYDASDDAVFFRLMSSYF